MPFSNFKEKSSPAVLLDLTRGKKASLESFLEFSQMNKFNKLTFCKTTTAEGKSIGIMQFITLQLVSISKPMELHDAEPSAYIILTQYLHSCLVSTASRNQVFLKNHYSWKLNFKTVLSYLMGFCFAPQPLKRIIKLLYGQFLGATVHPASISVALKLKCNFDK